MNSPSINISTCKRRRLRRNSPLVLAKILRLLEQIKNKPNPRLRRNKAHQLSIWSKSQTITQRWSIKKSPSNPNPKDHQNKSKTKTRSYHKCLK
jgi:hypothetical protein